MLKVSTASRCLNGITNQLAVQMQVLWNVVCVSEKQPQNPRRPTLKPEMELFSEPLKERLQIKGAQQVFQTLNPEL